MQDLLLQLDFYRSMGNDGICTKILKELADVIAVSPNDFWAVFGIQKGP